VIHHSGGLLLKLVLSRMMAKRWFGMGKKQSRGGNHVTQEEPPMSLTRLEQRMSAQTIAMHFATYTDEKHACKDRTPEPRGSESPISGTSRAHTVDPHAFTGIVASCRHSKEATAEISNQAHLLKLLYGCHAAQREVTGLVEELSETVCSLGDDSMDFLEDYTVLLHEHTNALIHVAHELRSLRTRIGKGKNRRSRAYAKHSGESRPVKQMAEASELQSAEKGATLSNPKMNPLRVPREKQDQLGNRRSLLDCKTTSSNAYAVNAEKSRIPLPRQPPAHKPEANEMHSPSSRSSNSASMHVDDGHSDHQMSTIKSQAGSGDASLQRNLCKPDLPGLANEDI